MKKWLFLILLLFTVNAYGADIKLSDLTEDATPGTDSLVYSVDAPLSVPVSRKITIGNLLNAANDLDANGDVADNSHLHDGSTISAIDISADTNLTGGTGILLTNDDLTFAPAELEGVSWGGGAEATIVHTFNVSGTDTTMTMGSASTTFSGDVVSTLDMTVTGSDLTLGTAGVKLTGDGDGALTILGLGDGYDEDLTLNLDDTENKGVLSSSTGLATIDFGSIGVDLDSATATLSTVSGAVDLGGATSFELPNANNPTTDAEGEIAWDANDDALEIYNGANSYLIPTLYVCSKTIIDPDGVQAVEDAIPLLEVTSDWAPYGITIKDIELSSDAANSGTYVLEEWTDPTTASSDIESLTFSNATEVTDDGTLADSAVAAGTFVFLDLDTTALNFLTVSFTYFVNEGN